MTTNGICLYCGDPIDRDDHGDGRQDYHAACVEKMEGNGKARCVPGHVQCVTSLEEPHWFVSPDPGRIRVCPDCLLRRRSQVNGEV